MITITPRPKQANIAAGTHIGELVDVFGLGAVYRPDGGGGAFFFVFSLAIGLAG
jgi:hypothetical protein